MKTLLALLFVLGSGFAAEERTPLEVTITCDHEGDGLGWQVRVFPDDSGSITYYFDPTRFGTGVLDSRSVDFSEILEYAQEALEKDREDRESQPPVERREWFRQFEGKAKVRVNVHWKESSDVESCIVEDHAFWNRIVRRIEGRYTFKPSFEVTQEQFEAEWQKIYFDDAPIPDIVPGKAEPAPRRAELPHKQINESDSVTSKRAADNTENGPLDDKEILDYRWVVGAVVVLLAVVSWLKLRASRR